MPRQSSQKPHRTNTGHPYPSYQGPGAADPGLTPGASTSSALTHSNMAPHMHHLAHPQPPAYAQNAHQQHHHPQHHHHQGLSMHNGNASTGSSHPSPLTSPDVPTQPLSRADGPNDMQQHERQVIQGSNEGREVAMNGKGMDSEQAVNGSVASGHAAAPLPSPAPSKKKHICATCERAFTTSGHLARHTRVHTGERNHKCPFPGCETRCSRQDNLQQHYRIHLSPGSRRSNSSATRAAIQRAMSNPAGPSAAGGVGAMAPPPPNAPPPLAHASAPPALSQAHTPYPPNPHAHLVAGPPPPLVHASPPQQQLYSESQAPSPKTEARSPAYAQPPASAYTVNSYPPSSASTSASSSANGNGTPNANGVVNGNGTANSQPQSPSAHSAPPSATASANASPVIGGHASNQAPSSYQSPYYASHYQPHHYPPHASQHSPHAPQQRQQQQQQQQQQQHAPTSQGPTGSAPAYANAPPPPSSQYASPLSSTGFYQQHHYPPQAYASPHPPPPHTSHPPVSQTHPQHPQQYQQTFPHPAQKHRMSSSVSHPSSGAPSPSAARVDLPASSPMVGNNAVLGGPSHATTNGNGGGAVSSSTHFRPQNQNGGYQHYSAAPPPVPSSSGSNSIGLPSSAASNGNGGTTHPHYSSNGSYSQYQLHSPPPSSLSASASGHSTSSHTSHNSYSQTGSAIAPRHSPPPVLAPIQKKTALHMSHPTYNGHPNGHANQHMHVSHQPAHNVHVHHAGQHSAPHPLHHGNAGNTYVQAAKGYSS